MRAKSTPSKQTDNIVQRAALSTVFDKENIDNVLEVVNGTKNPELAIIILLGQYEEPEYHEKVLTSSGVLATAISYDKWRDEIAYSYEENEQLYGYFPEGTKKEDVTLDNYEQLLLPSRTSNCVELYYRSKKMVKRTSTLTLSTWNSLKPVEEVH